MLGTIDHVHLIVRQGQMLLLDMWMRVKFLESDLQDYMIDKLLTYILNEIDDPDYRE